MKLSPIITSLLETDAYKFNMMNVVFHTFNKDTVAWAFRCRNNDVKFTSEMVDEIKAQLEHFTTLRFTKAELSWLQHNFPWLKSDYISYLKRWYADIDDLHINEPGMESYNDCGLAIEVRGTWLDTMLWEIAVLQIVNEVYYAFSNDYKMSVEDFKAKTIENLKPVVDGQISLGAFSEFGLRRRYSKETQDWLIKYLKENVPGFVGTSNVYLAMKYGVKSVGTQAHEFYMALQSHFEYNPAYINKFGMQAWVDEYETRLGIALTDTIGTDVFLKDFNLTFATLFSGVRHDSGDPYEWGEKMIAHYQNLGINPKTKTLLFSDSLNVEKAAKLYEYFKNRINVAFGIGTFLSNPSSHPLNIVMKIVECNGNPVAKLSNNPTKGMCRDAAYVDYLKRTIDWRLNHDA